MAVLYLRLCKNAADKDYFLLKCLAISYQKVIYLSHFQLKKAKMNVETFKRIKDFYIKGYVTGSYVQDHLVAVEAKSYKRDTVTP